MDDMARAARFDRYGDRRVLYVTDVPMPSRSKARYWSRSGPPASTRERPTSEPVHFTTAFPRIFPPGRAATLPASLSW